MSTETSNVDEFGDSSFLDDFDVDAAVAAGSPSVAPKRPPSESGSDEFGDSSFLKDFDVDAAIARGNQQRKVSPEAPVGRPLSDSRNEEFGNPSFLRDFDMENAVERTCSPVNKRQRVSPQSIFGKHNSSLASKENLEACLRKYYGYSSFKKGQLEAIQAILQDRDVTIFWATGSGKSLCYQIPALYSQRTAIVISPLISLMRDQVLRLNGLSDKPLATYLGSAQVDGGEEQRAMNGEYRLVYVTPEKIMTTGFLDRLARVDLCCIAVDEAHCVSQWGHDFRTDYLSAGRVLRGHPQLRRVPIIALTATAVPRIQRDISNNLQLRNPQINQQSFDRSNLIIKVFLKEKSNPLQSAMEPLIRSLIQEERRSGNADSTIVYAATRNLTQEVASYLQQRLTAENSRVEARAYHAGMTTVERNETHIRFLTGKTAVVVATVAFGMGIDKPDTRRVIHWGPPKSVEEYYQQIGRAGRDGIKAECILYASPSDFDRYLEDFYVGNLSELARQASIESTKALKLFALDREGCRRKRLLEFFEEKPVFGERCGTCDLCQSAKEFGDDSLRDFGPEARMILSAVSGLKEGSMGIVEKVLRGNVVEEYRYAYPTKPQQLKALLLERKKSLPRQSSTNQVLKEIVLSLSQKGYLTESSRSANIGGCRYKKSWTVYHVSQFGRKCMLNDEPIFLPVPNALREIERLERIRKERVIKNLEERGVPMDKLPSEEVESGDGETIRAYTKWNNYMALQEKLGKSDRCAQLDELLLFVQTWRSDAAVQHTMAPASVLPDYIMFSIAHAVATFPSGVKVSKPDLIAAGARTRELDSLVEILNSWIDRYAVKRDRMEIKQTTSHVPGDLPMIFPRGGSVAGKKWEFAVYKPQKKTGLATWESSYIRFEAGESPQAIAMSPANGRPIQLITVIGHIKEAFLQGRPVNLQRLSALSQTPTKHQWLKLEQAEELTGMDASGNPSCSGVGGGPFTMTDFLRPIMGDDFMDTPREERCDADRKKFSEWCNLLKWYLFLRRGGIEPIFGVTCK